jgi:hypothetical protein
MEERDRLVAQAAAFVQQVAAAHPQDSARPEIAKPLSGKTQAIEPALAEPAAAVPATEPAAPPPADAVAPPVPLAMAAAPRAVRLPPVSERSDIQDRVAAFRARQARVNAEREAYYEIMQAKIRSKLGNEPGGGRL